MAFTDAPKPTHGAFVKGCTGQHRGQSSWTKRDPQLDDWILTAAGVKWILLKQQRSEGIGRLAGHLKKHWPKVLKQLDRIRAHRLMADFVTDPADFNPDIGRLAELLRCRVDAPREVWVERFEIVRTAARISKQEDVLRCADACKTVYQVQL